MEVQSQYLKSILTEAGKILMMHFGKTSIVSGKAHRDILTEADLASDTFITKALQKEYPGVPVLSEETERTPEVENVQSRFVLDPLDGTINFSRGIGEFGISLAYQVNRKTVLGLVYLPVSGTFFEATKRKGSTYAGKILSVSDTRKLSEAVVAVDPAREHQSVPAYLLSLHKKIRAFRSYGCAVQVLGYIASGKIDAYVYDSPKLWDIAAMHCIIEEAGGLVLDQQGNPWHDGAPLLICTPGIREEILACLRMT